VEAFRVFTRETTQAWMIGSGTVLVETKVIRRPLPPSEHEPVANCRCVRVSGVAIAIHNGRCTKGIVTVPFPYGSIKFTHMGNTAFVVLVEILHVRWLKTNYNLIDPEPVDIRGINHALFHN